MPQSNFFCFSEVKDHRLRLTIYGAHPYSSTLMGQLIQIKELHQARRRRSEKDNIDQCVRLLEWNLKKSIDDYFASPVEERSMRATQIRRLSEILEYAVRLL